MMCMVRTEATGLKMESGRFAFAWILSGMGCRQKGSRAKEYTKGGKNHGE